ncbi:MULTISPECIES: sigma-70 family RNA polymerase sigma factor [Paenibacillus]|uniref:sigma-70 family RNA polymerase sigma factor n=1 Tax=Paenibacillus TaxID=44249 RepID=UPI002DB5EB8B|nr:sigma-70 family RNA polymerase sigma factor [Paenibacillus odorifer]MEC0134347.1 sigma-70 family RNA polymerase sigma factor [Paenibacillus odorifer]MEC0222927.1 sigma-70 family RNA polymerase sigma factor [Paenibacillus odorifer]
MVQASGPVYSNVSLIKRAIYLSGSGMLPQHEIVLFIIKNWVDINYEEAQRLANYALYAKNSYFREVNETGLWSLKNQTDSTMDEIFIHMQNERRPLTVRQMTNKSKTFDTQTYTAGLSMDIRFSAINSGNIDYWILSNWELANNILYQHMQNKQIESIHAEEVANLLTSTYGMDESTMIFSPQIDNRFHIKGGMISIHLTGGTSETSDAAIIPEILEEVARAGLLVCKYIEKNQKIKTSNIVINIFGIKPFEKQFILYCNAVDNFLSTLNEFNNTESNEWTFSNVPDQIEPEIGLTPFWEYSVRGYQIPPLLEIQEATEDQSQRTDQPVGYFKHSDQSVAYTKNTKRSHYVTYYERVRGYLYIPGGWKSELKTEISQDVFVEGFTYNWSISKSDISPYFFGNGVMDFFSDFKVVPGQKTILELDNEYRIYIRLGEVDAKRASDQSRLLDIGKLVNESKLINKSFFGIMVEILATHPSGIHNMVLFDKVNSIRSANHNTIKTLLYSNDCFVQLEEKKGYWKLDITKLSRVYIDEKGCELEDEVVETNEEIERQSKSLRNKLDPLIQSDDDDSFVLPDLWDSFVKWSKEQPGHRFSKLVEMSSDKKELEGLIVESYSKLVCKIAGNRNAHFMDRMDFVQEGFIGLLKSIDKYHKDGTTSFGNYTKYYVLSRMLRIEQDNQSLIRIPVHWNETLREFEKSVGVFVNEEKNWPSSFDILNANEKWNEQKLWEIERVLTLKNVDYISFEQFWDRLGDERLHSCYPWNTLEILDSKSRRLYFEEKGTRYLNSELDTLCEIVEEDSELFYDPLQIDDIILLKDLRKQLEHGMKQLTEREEEVLRLRFGFDDGWENTLEEVARHFGLTRERIRQIESKALGRLRNILGSSLLENWNNLLNVH